MAVLAENNGIKLWFGTQERACFFPTPLRGADTSPGDWNAGGALLNGGAYQLGSFGSHKRYTFEWSGASAREVAQLMKSYADGTYGRGLIYFQDPLTFSTNVLPAAWADPSMGVGYEGSSLVYGVEPTALPTSNWQVNDTPVKSAYYDLSSVAAGWRGTEEALFVPVPEGYTLFLGSVHSVSGSGGVFYRTQSKTGALGVVTALTPVAVNAGELLNTAVSGPDLAGVWLQVGKSASGAASVTMTAMMARFIKNSDALTPKADPLKRGPWVGGQGNSGVRFAGKPTYINNTGVNGGQVGFAASFVEVGSWLNG